VAGVIRLEPAVKINRGGSRRLQRPRLSMDAGDDPGQRPGEHDAGHRLPARPAEREADLAWACGTARIASSLVRIDRRQHHDRQRQTAREDRPAELQVEHEVTKPKRPRMIDGTPARHSAAKTDDPGQRLSRVYSVR